MRRTKASKRDPEAAEMQRAAMLAERARMQQERLQNQIRKVSRVGVATPRCACPIASMFGHA